MRHLWLLITVGLLIDAGCSRRETESQMRDRIRRQERERLNRRSVQADARVETEPRRRVEAVPSDSPLEKAPLVARPASKIERRPRPRLPSRRAITMSTTARPRARSPAPRPRRRLKRPRRRRSPSLEGLFE